MCLLFPIRQDRRKVTGTTEGMIAHPLCWQRPFNSFFSFWLKHECNRGLSINNVESIKRPRRHDQTDSTVDFTVTPADIFLLLSLPPFRLSHKSPGTTKQSRLLLEVWSHLDTILNIQTHRIRNAKKIRILSSFSEHFIPSHQTKQQPTETRQRAFT